MNFEIWASRRRPATRRGMRVFGAVWLLLTLGGLTAVILINATLASRVTATAYVTAGDIERHGEPCFAVSLPTTGGRQVFAIGRDEEFPNGEGLSNGDQVVVAFDPDDPGEVHVPQPGIGMVGIVVAGLLVLAGLVFNYSVWTGRGPLAGFAGRSG